MKTATLGVIPAGFVATLIRLKQEDFRPDRDIVLVLETDEEASDQDAAGMTWLLKNHRDLLSAPSSLNPELLRAVEKLTEEFWPGTPVIPTMLTGATDGLFLRNASIPTYGVDGFGTDLFDVRAHGKDERTPVKSFYEGVEFSCRLVKALSGGP